MPQQSSSNVNSNGQNFYNILGIKEQANADEILAAYDQKLAALNALNLSEKKREEQEKMLMKSYATLADTTKREQYDNTLTTNEPEAQYTTFYSSGAPRPETPTFEKVIEELGAYSLEELEEFSNKEKTSLNGEALSEEEQQTPNPRYDRYLELTALKQFFLGEDVSDHPAFKKEEELAKDEKTKVSYVAYFPNNESEKEGHSSIPVLERFVVPRSGGRPPMIVQSLDPATRTIEIVNESTFKHISKTGGGSVEHETGDRAGNRCLTFSQDAKDIETLSVQHNAQTGKQYKVYEAYYKDGELGGVINPERLKKELGGKAEFTIKTREGEELRFDKEKGRMVDGNGVIVEAIKAIDDNGNEINKVEVINGRGVHVSEIIEEAAKSTSPVEKALEKAGMREDLTTNTAGVQSPVTTTAPLKGTAKPQLSI